MLPFGQEAWERVGDEFRSKMSNSTVVRDNESLRKDAEMRYTRRRLQ